MPEVQLTVMDRKYRIACDEGEEQRLERLAEYLNSHVDQLVAQYGHIGDSRILILASLNLCDELFAAREASDSPGGAERPDIAALLNTAADRIEQLATALSPSEADATPSPSSDH